MRVREYRQIFKNGIKGLIRTCAELTSLYKEWVEAEQEMDTAVCTSTDEGDVCPAWDRLCSSEGVVKVCKGWC